MNMKKLFLLGIVFSFFIGGCKNNSPGKIRVENRLHKKIICILDYNYPDTSLTFTNKQALLADSNRLQIDTNQIKEVDTIGLCKKNVWDNCVKQSLLMLIVFDEKKLVHAKKPEDALIERYYFSYGQLMKDKGVIVVY